MSNGGMEVPPLKRVDIAQIADFIRRAAFPTREPKAFPIVDRPAHVA